ncbi:cytochrome c biogenesis protein [Myxococcota bacterium]|nr:cytochrome c biogenesis protein [Myxococcota bacterium]MBU1432843.1 cytochrome c biogenesis protein [Myxococcota bacterium]MBU1897527.1 cytochrome c biogenesis protein [Myxococcota bacterium]
MKNKLYLAGLALLSVALFLAHWLVFVYVPTEPIMGVVQRIFYFHVPAAWLCYLGFIITFIGSVGYIWNRSPRADALALAGADIGLVFGWIVMLTGPLWARATWGVWWKWEPRLTSMALLVLIFAAYWVLRRYGGGTEGVRRFGAVLAIFGAPNIAFVHVAVKKWRGDHPGGVVGGGLDPDMRLAFFICLAVLQVLFIYLFIERYRVIRDEEAIGALRRRLSRLKGR